MTFRTRGDSYLKRHTLLLKKKKKNTGDTCILIFYRIVSPLINKYNDNIYIRRCSEYAKYFTVSMMMYYTLLRRKVKKSLLCFSNRRVRIILAQFPLVLCSRVSLYPSPSARFFLSSASKVRNSR